VGSLLVATLHQLIPFVSHQSHELHMVNFEAKSLLNIALFFSLCAAQAEHRGLTEAEVAIAFALHSGAAAVVVGAASSAHFEDAVRGTAVSLTDAEVQWLRGSDDDSEGRNDNVATSAAS